jgi:O-antigen/teichoic acid export membrane protein
MNKARTFSYLFVANALAALSAFLGNVAIANRIGPSLYGQYSYMLTLGSLITDLIIFGTADVGVRLLRKNPQDGVWNLLLFRSFNFAAAAVGLILYGYFEGNHQILALFVASSAFNLSVIFEVRGLNVAYAKIYLFERCAIITLTVIYVFTFSGISLFHIGLIYVLASLFSVAFQIQSTRPISFSLDYKFLKTAYTAGFVYSVLSIAKFCYGGGARMHLAARSEYEAVANLSIALQFLALFSIISVQLNRVFRLDASLAADGGDFVRFGGIARSFFFYSLTFGFSVALFLALLSPIIATMLYADVYKGLDVSLQLCGLYIIVVSLEAPLLTLGIAIGMLLKMVVIYSTVSIFALIFMIFFGARWGANEHLMFMIAFQGISCLVGYVSLYSRIQYFQRGGKR